MVLRQEVHGDNLKGVHDVPAFEMLYIFVDTLNARRARDRNKVPVPHCHGVRIRARAVLSARVHADSDKRADVHDRACGGSDIGKQEDTGGHAVPGETDGV